jgi:hypothetical protein
VSEASRSSAGRLTLWQNLAYLSGFWAGKRG